jgi:hypothetical protein
VAQRGQALVGVMVVMVILFALAGAVAIGASTLLTSRGSSNSVNNDFRLHSAVNDSVAQVAGSTHTCGAAPPPSPLPTPTSSPIPTPLTLALPPPDSTSQTPCVRMDGVAIGAVRRIAVPAPSGQTCASSFDLPFTGPVRVAVVFDVHETAVPNSALGSPWGWAYLVPNDFQQVLGCPTLPPNTLNGSPCETTIPASSTPTWTQVALTCDITGNETAQLRIKGSATSPRQVFAAPQDPHASTLGSFYLLAIQSPVSGAAMEEALLFVSNDGKTNRLQYEAPLLP